MSILEEHAPLKEKLLRANQTPYVTKALRKTIVRISYFRTPTTPSSLKKFKKKHYCSKLYKKDRKAYFDKINKKKVSDNKRFWKNMQPLFSKLYI